VEQRRGALQTHLLGRSYQRSARHPARDASNSNFEQNSTRTPANGVHRQRRGVHPPAPGRASSSIRSRSALDPSATFCDTTPFQRRSTCRPNCQTIIIAPRLVTGTGTSQGLEHYHRMRHHSRILERGGQQRNNSASGHDRSTI
jgi:hypothetical protein